MGIISTITFPEAIGVIYRTVIIFLYAFILLRLLGRKRLSHLTYIDLLLIISYGSAVGDVMIYGESIARLFTSMVAITVVAVLVKIFDEFSARSVQVQNLIEGQARLLINNGELIEEALEKENISKEKLMTMLREHNIQSIASVSKAFIEYDGDLSIVHKKKNNHNGGKK